MDDIERTLLSEIPPTPEQVGRFEGEVVAKWIDDGRKMTLVQPFAYVDPRDLRWEAPSGSTVDGASIPRFAWSIIGGPFEGRYRNASVIHDVACDNKLRPWEAVHEAFYTAMLTSGVGHVQAKVMYAALFHFGPRWPLQLNLTRLHVRDFNYRFSTTSAATEHDSSMFDSEMITVGPPPYSMSMSQFDVLREAIVNENLTLAAIRDFSA